MVEHNEGSGSLGEMGHVGYPTFDASLSDDLILYARECTSKDDLYGIFPHFKRKMIGKKEFLDPSFALSTNYLFCVLSITQILQSDSL